MIHSTSQNYWTGWQKIVFRFLFLFLGFFLFNYQVAFAFLMFQAYDKINAVYSTLKKPLQWMDKHFYHSGYDPQIHESFPGDNHFGLAFYSTFVILCLLITIAWTVTDKRRPNYQKLYYWFSVYIRYMVAAVMLAYGIDKIIPVQMAYPDVTEMLKPMGDQDYFSIAWNFVGLSPGYEMFSGTIEIIASLLFIFRRTFVPGGLMMCGVLVNIIAINIFYNIGVKFYSIFLLVSVLFILAPYFKTLIQIFLLHKNVTLAENSYHFNTKWKKYLLMALCIVLIAGTIIGNGYNDYQTLQRRMANKKIQKLYDVKWFIAKDTIPPLLNDTMRWRKFTIVNAHLAVIYNMRDSASEFQYDVDSSKLIYRLHDNEDSLKWDQFHYSYSQKNKLNLTGKWKGMDVQVMMEEIPIDSMNLNKEKLKLLED